MSKKETVESKVATYVVKKGDKLHQIATQHKMSLAKLKVLNELTPKSKIEPGMTLKLSE